MPQLPPLKVDLVEHTAVVLVSPPEVLRSQAPSLPFLPSIPSRGELGASASDGYLLPGSTRWTWYPRSLQCLDEELSGSAESIFAALRLLRPEMMAVLLGAELKRVEAAIRELGLEPEGWTIDEESYSRPQLKGRRCFYTVSDVGRVGEVLSKGGTRLAGPAGYYWRAREFETSFDVSDGWPGYASVRDEEAD